MKPSTVVRFALAGTRTDTMRVVLTAVSAALLTVILLAIATVATPPRVQHLRPIDLPQDRALIVVVLALLAVPVAALMTQCALLGAPARDRRLAGMRLAGATPRQIVHIGAVETGIAAGPGSLAGLAVYQAVLAAVSRPGDGNDRLWPPTGEQPPGWAIAGVCLGVVLVAAGAATLRLRRVAVRPSRWDRPGLRPLIVLLVAIAIFATYVPLMAYTDGYEEQAWLMYWLFGAGLVMAAGGLGVSAGWLSYVTGRVLHRFARRPATLIAARRLLDDPWSGSRTLGTLLVGVMFGAWFAWLRSYSVAYFSAIRDWWAVAGARGGVGLPDVGHQLAEITGLIDLIGFGVTFAVVVAVLALLVAFVERVLSRRRTYAALVATGVPRSVLVRAALWHAAAPAIPAILLSTVVGVLLGMALTGVDVSQRGDSILVCDTLIGSSGSCTGSLRVDIPALSRVAPVPWAHLGVLGGGAIVLVPAMVALSLTFLRASTNVSELRTA